MLYRYRTVRYVLSIFRRPAWMRDDADYMREISW